MSHYELAAIGHGEGEMNRDQHDEADKQRLIVCDKQSEPSLVSHIDIDRPSGGEFFMAYVSLANVRIQWRSQRVVMPPIIPGKLGWWEPEEQ